MINLFKLVSFYYSNTIKYYICYAIGLYIYNQAAIVSNLIRSVYIIFPTWTTNESSIYNASIGQTPVNFTNRNQLCICLLHQNAEETCQTRTIEAEEMERQIPPHLCTSRIATYRLVELTSRNAASGTLRRLLRREDPAPLIIDIDEDFFGVQLPAACLLQHGWDLTDLLQISDVIHKIICQPINLSAKEELRIDSWFHKSISYLIESRCLSSKFCFDIHDNTSLPESCKFAIHKIASTIIPRWRCPHASSSIYHLERLVKFLSLHTLKELKVLLETGICLEYASRTYGYKPNMGLCLGHNLPGSSVIPEYIPTYDSIVELGRNLTRILKAISPRKPIVITIARSARDGYVVRKLQPLIETTIQLVLKHIFNLTDANFHYSDYLAGGIPGWSNRYHWPIN